MLLSRNDSLPSRKFILESDQASCDELDIFFKDAMKDIIYVSDRIICAVNVLFSFISMFANILILYALYKASSLHSPSKALLCSLALSDLGVGAIVQPLFVAYRWAQINGNLPDLCTAAIISHIEGKPFVCRFFPNHDRHQHWQASRLTAALSVSQHCYT